MRSIAQFLTLLLSFYYLMIIVRILLTYFQQRMGSTPESALTVILRKSVDPFLDLFRRLFPVQLGNLDLSPIFALLSVSLVQRLLQIFIYTGKMTLGYAMAFIIRSLWWSAGAYIVGIVAILLAIRLYFCYHKSPLSIQLIAALERLVDPILDFVHRLIFAGKEIANKKLIWATLIFIVAIFILLSLGINQLANLLVQLQV